MSYTHRGNNPKGKEEVWKKNREEKEREKKRGQKAGDLIKIEREWERREQLQRGREKKENTR